MHPFPGHHLFPLEGPSAGSALVLRTMVPATDSAGIRKPQQGFLLPCSTLRVGEGSLPFAYGPERLPVFGPRPRPPAGPPKGSAVPPKLPRPAPPRPRWFAPWMELGDARGGGVCRGGPAGVYAPGTATPPSAPSAGAPSAKILARTLWYSCSRSSIVLLQTCYYIVGNRLVALLLFFTTVCYE